MVTTSILKMLRLAALFAFALAATAAAQPYPSRVITIVVPLPPGRCVEQGEEVPPAEQQSPQGFRAFHKAETEKWWPIIKAANIRDE